MASQGLHIVHDPSTFFLQARDPSLSGTALIMAMEGQRPFAVEIQGLASKSFLAIPRRTALGLDTNRLHLLLAIMERKLRINFGQTDVYAKVGGGLRLQEPGMDLGLVAALLSSYYDRPLPEKGVFWGEVDLSGQVRPVWGQDLRLRQARALGYSPVICPPVSEAGSSGAEDLRPVSTVFEMQRTLFGK
jgi:DNA repair protein RadA/Sms